MIEQVSTLLRSMKLADESSIFVGAKNWMKAKMVGTFVSRAFDKPWVAAGFKAIIVLAGVSCSLFCYRNLIDKLAGCKLPSSELVGI
jgi:hypothetical protein